MVLFTVHRESVKKSYRAHLCSMALMFYISISAISYIVPMYLAYQSLGFWVKEHSYHEQPDVHFKHEFVLLLRTASKIIGYSTIENLNTILLAENIRFPVVQSYEMDQNLDGKNDYMVFEVQTPVLDSELIQSVQLLLFFDYRLYTYSSVRMESLAFISFNTCIPGAEFNTNGILKLVQKYPLPHKGSFTKYNIPVIDSASKNVLDFDLHTILANYQARNISTTFVGYYPIWRGQPSSSVPFSIKVQIEYPEEIIIYHPGFWQLIKFAWIQYLAVLLIFTYFSQKIKKFVFENQIFDTIFAQEKVHVD